MHEQGLRSSPTLKRQIIYLDETGHSRGCHSRIDNVDVQWDLNNHA